MTARPRIVVLDGFALNPGDLSWEALATLGALTVHDRTGTDPALIAERAAGAGIVLTNKTPLAAATLAALPALRYVGVLATGWNVVDVAAARGRGAWTRSADFCFTLAPLVELAGKTMGIVGFGVIGRAPAWGGFAFVEMDDLFRQADVISLHCALTPATEKLVDERRLSLVKPTALLVNTARGGLVAEEALAAALAAGRIAGAGLDVLGTEPPRADNPLLSAPNVTITPHVGWATREARERLLAAAAGNVEAFLAGAPRSVVS